MVPGGTMLKELAERHLTIAQLRVWIWLHAQPVKRIFPSEMARSLGLNAITIRHALQALREMGLLESDQHGRAAGKVWKVVRDPRQWKPE